MASSSAFALLVDANPISSQMACDFAERVRLDELVRQRIAWNDRPAWAGASGNEGVRNGRRARRPALALAVAAILAVGVVASPALGFLKDSVLPFFGLEKAPAPVQLDFASLGVGAPAGMDPRAIAGETRGVDEAVFGDAKHKLWVAPTAGGGFCYLWSPGYGGCHAGGGAVLDAIGPAELPQGVIAPTVPAGASAPEKIAAIERGHALATITPWVVGFVTGTGAESVQVRFSDGSIAHPAITWISAPINAGFYVYVVPPGEQTRTDHVVSVQALAANGAVVAQQDIPTGG